MGLGDPEGLEDQVLNQVVQVEEPQKDQQRQNNIQQSQDLKDKQKKTEDAILKMLFEAKGDLLDDEQLIETLKKSARLPGSRLPISVRPRTFAPPDVARCSA